MKNLLGAISLLLLSTAVFAQATDGTEQLSKAYNSEPAVLIYLPYCPTVVNQLLHAYVSNTLKKGQVDSKAYQLASNTEFAKNNSEDANIVFAVGLKDYTNPNETVVYMRLNSTVEVSYPTVVGKKITFDAQQAKDFLNNFAIAIEPYATDLQLQLQKKELLLTQAKCETLKKQGLKLEKDRQKLAARLQKNASKNISRKQLLNQQEIALNQAKQTNQMRELDKQKASVASFASYGTK